MNEDPAEDRESESDPAAGPQSQEIRHNQVSALVPEHVARGTFSTGAVVLHGNHEFILDFLVRMQQPQQVAARIVLPPAVVAQFIQALRENLKKYSDRFGASPRPTVPQQAQQGNQPNAQELYDQLKLSEDVMSGNYANAVMIGHTATEFSFDFITTFFPRSCVAHRVYLSAPNVPRLLDSLNHSYNQFLQRHQQTQPQPNPPPETSTGDAAPGD